MSEYILEMKGITKTFPGVVALDHVDLAVKQGEVHALVGENGAGKSTLMKILNGVYTADHGDIFLYGEKTRIHDTTDAKKRGLGLIFQEFNLVNTLSAAENIFLNRQMTNGIRVDWKRMNLEAQKLIDRLGFHFDVTQITENLSAAQKQLVEIAKALSYDTRIVIMDEPTSSLTIHETEKLFDIIARLKQDGITVIYISHKLDEIYRICDAATVLCDGKVIETRKTADFPRAEIIQSMVGRSVDMAYPRRVETVGEVVLKATNVCRTGILEDISFELHRGEILGIAGLIGSGRTELAEVLFGAERITSGEVEVFGKKAILRGAFDGKKNGIGLLTEDRKETGLVLEYELTRNVTITNLNRVRKGMFLAGSLEKTLSWEYAKNLNVKTPSMKQVARNLSGGNQQKLVFAKWLFSDVSILILDEPTRGIDVGAKYEIYLLMNKLAEQGKSIIMISSELTEVLGMSDRVLVMSGGRLKGEMKREEATPEAVMSMTVS